MYAAIRQWATIWIIAFVLLVIYATACPVSGQEIFVNGGLGVRTDREASIRGQWSVAYFQHLADHVTFSISYINEGHQPEHARDGIALQMWGRGVPFGGGLSFAGGVGPYIFSDTRDETSGRGREIVHGVGAILSGTATWHVLSPVLLQVRGNYIKGPNGLDTFSGSVGMGYLLGSEGGGSSLSGDHSARNEVDCFLGGTALNNYKGSAVSFGVEYRRKLFPYLDWTVAWLHEGDRRPIGRYGVMSEVWAVRVFYGDRLGLGIGAGAYLARSRYAGDTESRRDALNAVVSLTAVWRFTSRLGFRAVFHRIATDHGSDADVFMGGLAISF